MADELYRPGYSFMNPPVTKIASPQRSRPWFWQPTAPSPLDIESKAVPLEMNPRLNRYQAVWNREMRNRNREKLGAYFREVPTIQELGQAPAATSTTQTTGRSVTGFLENLISKATEAASAVTTQLTSREQQKTQVAMAQAQSYFQPIMSAASANVMPIMLGLGVVGILIFAMKGAKK